MLSKIVGATIGGNIAKKTKNIGGTTGAEIGAAAPIVLSRLSIPAMVAMGVGGYFVKKYLDKNKGDETVGAKDTGSIASIPQPKSA